MKLITQQPTFANSFLAARIYQSLGQWVDETNAWNYAAQEAPAADRLKPYFCLALSAYAAKQKPKGDLAAAKSLTFAAKAQRLSQKSALQSGSDIDQDRAADPRRGLSPSPAPLTSSFPPGR